MKIKIIDLLVKIANGKEVPKKIKYRNYIWKYTSTVKGKGYQYYSVFYQEWKTLQNQVYLEECLNDEVEIIEEDKKFEEIEELTCSEYDFKTKTINSLIKNQRILIDEINKLKEEK